MRHSGMSALGNERSDCRGRKAGFGSMASPRIIDWSASADRIETIADSLTNAGKAFDRVETARAAEYCRRRAAGKPESERAEIALTEFVRAHHQLLDWIFYGDPRCMIAELAGQ